MAEKRFKYDDVDSVPFAEITKDGIKYGVHEFNAKTTVKDTKTGKEIEVTVVRRAEREWLLGGGAWCFITAYSGMVFNLDQNTLKAKAEELYGLLKLSLKEKS